MRRMQRRMVVAGWLVLAAGGGVRAHDNYFAYVVEPKTSARGEVEAEQWLTGRWGHHTGSYAAADFREEVEYGLTDRAGLALHFDYSYLRDTGGGPDAARGWQFEEAGAEWTYQFSNPYTAPLGSLLYLEYSAHEDGNEIEGKLAFGKEWDGWRAAVNVIGGAEWASGGNESELAFAGACSRDLGRGWAAGVEALHRRAYEGAAYREENHSATFAGPSLHYTAEHFHLVCAVLPQLQGDGAGSTGGLQLEEEERVQTRLVASWEF